MRKHCFKVIMVGAILSVAMQLNVYAGEWAQVGDNWVYYNDDGSLKTGWFNDVNNSAWYYFDDNGVMVKGTWIESDGKQYYISDDGKMLVNAVTPDGQYVNRSGEKTDIAQYDHCKEDKMSFESNSELVTIPCKIYYNDNRVGRYTTVHYDSVGIQAYNGKAPGLIITYTVTRTGGYSSTYMGIDVYVNGTKTTTLGGAHGDVKIKFGKSYLVVDIPYKDLKSGDLVEFYLNG